MLASAQASDLLESIDWHATECLNASTQHSLDNALKQVPLLSRDRYCDTMFGDTTVSDVLSGMHAFAGRMRCTSCGRALLPSCRLTADTTTVADQALCSVAMLFLVI
jgi:hypothetical protein